jgi:hypothetical protein
MKFVSAFLFLILLSFELFAQVPQAGNLVKIHEVTTEQADTISNLTKGMLIYNLDSNRIMQYTGSAWAEMSVDNDTLNELITNIDVRADSTFITQNGKILGTENARRVYFGQFIITSTGNIAITGIPFKPTAVEFTAYANVDAVTLNADNGVGNNNTGINNSYGYMKGYAQVSGSTFTEQVICGGGSGNSINDISRYASNIHCIGVRYGDQNGSSLGITSAEFVSFDDDGFTVNVDSRADNLLVMFTAYR